MGSGLAQVLLQLRRKSGLKTHKKIQLREFQQIFTVNDVSSKSGARLIDLLSYNLSRLRPVGIQLTIRVIFAQIIIHIKIYFLFSENKVCPRKRSIG